MSVVEAAAAIAKSLYFPRLTFPAIYLVSGTCAGQLHVQRLTNVVDIYAGDLKEFSEAARTEKVVVICGIN